MKATGSEDQRKVVDEVEIAEGVLLVEMALLIPGSMLRVQCATGSLRVQNSTHVCFAIRQQYRETRYRIKNKFFKQFQSFNDRRKL
jgi:hypothetical protein